MQAAYDASNLCNQLTFCSSKTSSQVMTRSRAGIAAHRQFSNDIYADRHEWVKGSAVK